MPENPFTETPLSPVDRQAVAQAEPEVQSGANWFWWIAGLSLVNSVINHSGGATSFVIGLGFTLLADAIFRENFLFVALIIDAIAIGAIFGLGWFSRKGHLWAFITGIILYSIDALIYLMFGDMMSLGFHCFALFFMVRGGLKLHKALKAARSATPRSPDLPPVLPG